TIPDTVTSIGDYTFQGCTSLGGVYFQGNAPSAGSFMFVGAGNLTVYYLPGTTGWGSPFDGITAVVWMPQIQTSDGSFGVRMNQFGFTITWASDLVVVVEACTNLANPLWSPVGTNTLTNGSSYFSDPQWTNYPSRLYRLRSP
ncbi:MAG TPA: leucine-rich repeat protein, partial [Verrucomicrobiae bacterium]